MNLYKEIEEIEQAEDRIKESQNAILDMYDKHNTHHKRIMNELNELLDDYAELKEKYKELAKII